MNPPSSRRLAGWGSILEHFHAATEGAHSVYLFAKRDGLRALAILGYKVVSERVASADIFVRFTNSPPSIGLGVGDGGVAGAFFGHGGDSVGHDLKVSMMN
jgi:hypothetical protein